MDVKRISEITKLRIKTLTDGVTKIAPDAYNSVRSEEIVYLAIRITELEAENASLNKLVSEQDAQLKQIYQIIYDNREAK